MIFKKKKEYIEVNQKQKEEYFDFDQISSYYQWKVKEPSFQNINDHTWADLDMEEVFMLLDRTHSSPGQQYLYYLVRSISKSDRASKIERTITQLNEEENHTVGLIKALKKINTRGSYFLHRLFSKENLKKPRRFWVVHLLFFLTVGSTLIVYFFPPLILLLVCLLTVNFIIHFFNKANLMMYSNAISQLYHFNVACNQLTYLYGMRNDFSKAQSTMNRLSKKSSLLREKVSSQSELSQVADFFIEILKASLLIEPLMLYHITNEIERNKRKVEILFEYVGFVDSCLSIRALRATSNVTIPNTTTNRKLIATDCYHPLIGKPVVNSIHIEEDKSVLVSGSNMSGKTTFIRTLGVNALLGQTINTVFAAKWIFPKAKIFSAIRISDDLLNDESFYQKEVQVIKEMIETSTMKEIHLFLIDELYKGTNSIERIGAGVAALSYLAANNNLVCASTHDLELTEFLKDEYTNYHFTEQVNEDSIEFDYKLYQGKLQNTNAIRILEANSYPREITEKARKIANQLSAKKIEQSVS